MLDPYRQQLVESEPGDELQTTSQTTSRATSPVREQDSVGDAVRLLWDERRFIWRITRNGLILSTLVVLLLPNRYTSTTRLMPPEQQSSTTAALMSMITGRVGSLPGGLSGFLGAKTPGDLFIAILRSHTVEDALIDRFDLRKVYWRKYYEGARKDLEHGSAGTVLANRDWLASDPCFWILYADVLTNANLKQMVKVHLARQPAATLGLYQVPDPSRCGVVSFDEQMIVREFVEKPARPVSRWAFSGVMIGTPKLLNQIPSRSPTDLGFDVLPRMVGDMLAYPISEYLIDIGTLENYQAAQVNWPGLVA